MCLKPATSYACDIRARNRLEINGEISPASALGIILYLFKISLIFLQNCNNMCI